MKNQQGGFANEDFLIFSLLGFAYLCENGVQKALQILARQKELSRFEEEFELQWQLFETRFREPLRYNVSSQYDRQ